MSDSTLTDSAAKQISWRLLISVIGITVILDQLTKYWVQSTLTLGQEINILPKFFNITLTHNRGAAFGMLSNTPDPLRSWILALMTLVALSALLYFVFHDYYHDKIAQATLALILGGALGNIIDRLYLGYVVDFLDFYIAPYHWPAFNMADSAICVGVVILIFRRPASSTRTQPAN